MKKQSTSPRVWYLSLLGSALALTGAILAAGGAYLAALGGSWYYLLAGAGLTVAGIQVARSHLSGAIVFAGVLLATVIWSIWEVGFEFWPLVPRLGPFLVMTAVLLAILPHLTDGRGRRAANIGALAVLGGIIVGFASMFQAHGVIRPDTPKRTAGPAAHNQTESRWQYFGRTPAGTRFAPEEQITPANVASLKVAWTMRTGDMSKTGVEAQNTPLQIGNRLYACTPRNQVLALDADSGKVQWRFDPGIRETSYSRCRGLGYHETDQVKATNSASTTHNFVAECRKQIVMTTVSAKMLAFDAETGKACKSFGQNGVVDLQRQVGGGNPAFYFQTSAPTIVRNLVIVGSFVMDGRAEKMQSGVIRAYDVKSGKLVWAFDASRPNETTPPADGKDFAPSTPNMWSTPAFDDKLGMIYLPLGGGSDDFWSENRSKATEEYSTSILALDIATGRERWKFQTVHHDLWDYDVASQPALVDVLDEHGQTVPALIQPTKTAQIFMLDRRTGKPISPVKELPVPQRGQPGNRTSRTQPYSVGMPQIGSSGLTEASMWGATFFDQLACRIAFRKVRYEGPFTPITTKPTLFYPGYYGGFNWGGVSIDESRNLMILNDIRMPQVVTLVPQAEVDPKEASVSDSLGLYPQQDGAFATRHQSLMSVLGIPCNSPPWGTMTAIDLKTRQIVWQRPMGTIKDSVLPIGVKSPLPIPVGMPTLGGPMTTASGLTFYSGTQDYYLRAIDTQTGDELWKGRLPVGTQSTPMTYTSPKSGRQYVIVTAGGSRGSPDHGDFIIAYALPKKAP
ncbi:membrane-bound PQQ-dependent dehydrogenase, glucose/quinate/shikimate family [Novosphingobium sp. FGD1]|uniref:Membrane-bound PQQ-dependent dehydrogenase, glucose/quinate/shikimate family n=1 Tax=Novosphingobium silvae TaxID=2692619 RepID=A0A7X4GL16_9SPHN|nr:membrane-bound PQQ-dependent dehydrogenase, glucose/quinate/shikimate family [Novosphingobium silvae]MYM00190.1 membrane-bound PQQ-dependent dehydrogenase, glucose/quinate/shikimate family [Novosphingobium silvae]